MGVSTGNSHSLLGTRVCLQVLRSQGRCATVRLPQEAGEGGQGLQGGGTEQERWAGPHQITLNSKPDVLESLVVLKQKNNMIRVGCQGEQPEVGPRRERWEETESSAVMVQPGSTVATEHALEGQLAQIQIPAPPRIGSETFGRFLNLAMHQSLTLKWG